MFVGVLVVLLSGSLLPSQHLGRIWDYRALQSAPIGLMIGLPQLILAPIVAWSLYRKWIDARVVLSGGLLLIALSCLCGSQLTAAWMWEQFVLAQTLQAFGQPMVVVALLYLICSVVAPPEGRYIAGTVNMLRALGVILGTSLVTQFTTVRERFHREMLLDHIGANAHVITASNTSELAASVSREAFVLAIADAYRILGVMALVLIQLALCLNYVAPPAVQSAPSKPATHNA
jgi:DHA2 family multidrug resistance protein